MHTAFKIVPRGAHVPQFLCAHNAVFFRRGLHFCFFFRDVICVQDTQLFFAGGDVKRQFVIEVQCFVIQHVQRLDVFEQRMFMLEQVVGDLVDLTLHVFETCGEFRKRRGPSQKTFPKRGFAAHIQFRHGKPADRGDDGPQAVARWPDVLVAHVLQHRLADLLQFGLSTGAEGHD